MGNRASANPAQSLAEYERTKEQPVPGVAATLYYFGGRGLADQIRWMLAASDITFAQKIVDSRAKFVKMSERQLIFGQLPLLQIDGVELVQSQAIIRYIAHRSNLTGNASNPTERVYCDMIAETVRDMISLLAGTPFQRFKGAEAEAVHKKAVMDKWKVVGARFEEILRLNGGRFLVGSQMTYADILVAHALTWVVEECGSDLVAAMPGLVGLQNNIINLPGIQSFIKSDRYYPIGDSAYVQQIATVLDRKI